MRLFTLGILTGLAIILALGFIQPLNEPAEELFKNDEVEQYFQSFYVLSDYDYITVTPNAWTKRFVKFEELLGVELPQAIGYEGMPIEPNLTRNIDAILEHLENGLVE